MRLYNATTRALVNGTAAPTLTPNAANNARHLNQQARQPGKSANYTLGRPKSLARRGAGTADMVEPHTTVGGLKRSSPRGVRKFLSVRPPSSSVASASFESAGPEVVRTNTSSTAESGVTAAFTPSHPFLFRGSFVLSGGGNPKKRTKGLSPPVTEHKEGLSPGRGNKVSVNETQERNSLKNASKATNWGFASAFHSPLRLSKMQLRQTSSPRLYKRASQGEDSIKLLPSTDRSCSPEQPNAHERTTKLVTTYSASEDAHGSNVTDKQDNPSLASNSDAPQPNQPLTPDCTASSLNFQSPSRKSELPEKKQQAPSSPQRSKTATSAASSSKRFDDIPGRVSTSSFHFDIDVVKSSEKEEGKAVTDDYGSVLSKNSSSTLSSNWFENELEPQAGDVGPFRDIPDPFHHKLCSPSSEFVVQPKKVASPSDLENPQSASEGLYPTTVDSAWSGEAQPSFFESAWSGETWPDDDSWIDFCGDPFGYVMSKNQRATDACVLKSSTASPPPLEDRQKVTRPQSSVGCAKPQTGTRRNPALLAHLLQAQFQSPRPRQQKAASEKLGDPKIEAKDTLPLRSTDDPVSCNLPEKYARMLKIGLPEEVVRQAIAVDGVDTAVSTCRSCPATIHTEVQKVDQFRRFRVHWDNHNNVRSNTLWAMIQGERPWIAENITIDEAEFLDLFQETRDPILTAMAKQDICSALTHVIDPKRASNGEVILARIKLSSQDIANAIDRIEHDAFSLEQMQGLLSVLPTPDEEAKLRDYISKNNGQDSLDSECEKFMASVIPIPQAKEKLEAMVFMKQFSAAADGLKNDSRLLQKACEEIMSSSRLRRVLGVVLDLGNRLNTAGVTWKEEARAIRLGSLTKLTQETAFDRKTTFLQFVANIFRRSSPDSVQLREDMPSLQRAEKIDLNDLNQTEDELEGGITNIRQMALRIGGGAICPEAELEVLDSTPIGRFTLEACLKMASVYDDMERARACHSKLLQYFGEEETTDVPLVFPILSAFCDQLEAAFEDGAAHCRRISIRWSLSSFGNDLDAIRCKAISMSSSSEV